MGDAARVSLWRGWPGVDGGRRARVRADAPVGRAAPGWVASAVTRLHRRHDHRPDRCRQWRARTPARRLARVGLRHRGAGAPDRARALHRVVRLGRRHGEHVVERPQQLARRRHAQHRRLYRPVPPASGHPGLLDRRVHRARQLTREVVMSSPAPTPDLHTGFSAPGATPTPWEDVVGVLVAAELFWISTVRTNGRPHVTPLPAVWRDGALYFCTGPGEQKALNLRANDQCVLTTGDNRWKAGLDIVVEGRAEQVTDDALLRALAAMWKMKYDGDWQYHVRDGAFDHEPGGAHVFQVRPSKVLSFATGAFAH